MKDLYVLVADIDIAATVKALLNERYNDLGIQRIDFDVARHIGRDPGCWKQSGAMLQGLGNEYDHALVIFDRHGCGGKRLRPIDLRSDVERDLAQLGWQNRSRAIVLDPEIEAWMWTSSPHTPRILGWGNNQEPLRLWLEQRGLWPPEQGKPPDPKLAAVNAMVEKRHRKPKRRDFETLALSAPFSHCQDPAFVDFRDTLRAWFPPTMGTT